MNIVLVLIPVALSLLGGKLTRQLILMQFVGIIFVVGFTGFLFGHTLRRQFNAIRGQLPARRYAHAIRARQLWTNALFHLRTRRTVGCRAE